MRHRANPNRTVLGALLGALLLLSASPAAAKPRSVLILPFAPTDLGREEQWLGEAVAESLGLALIQVPALVQIDRGRLKTCVPAGSLEREVRAVGGRALSADIALYGEVRRAAGDLSILPRFIEVKGDQAAPGALEPIAVPEGALLERLKGLPVAYLRALKVSATDVELARVQKYAAPHRVRPRPRGVYRAARCRHSGDPGRATRRRWSFSAGRSSSIRSSWWPSTHWAWSTRPRQPLEGGGAVPRLHSAGPDLSRALQGARRSLPHRAAAALRSGDRGVQQGDRAEAVLRRRVCRAG